MFYERCAQGQVLLDAYMQAIARRDALISTLSRDPYDYEGQVAQDMVRECRTLYWNHIYEHGCRVDRKDAVHGH